eukprot:PhM_4_TR6304/c0_g1_i1/m.105174
MARTKLARTGPKSLSSYSSDGTSLRASLMLRHALSRRCLSVGDRSDTLNFVAYCSVKNSHSLWSKSSPPRCVFPPVDRTRHSVADTVMTVTSKVPPPRSTTQMCFPCAEPHKPYARAAAVGSLRIESTSRFAICAAERVASLCAELKYAGTVMTTFLTSHFRLSSAMDFMCVRIAAATASGVTLSPLSRRIAHPPLKGTISYGTRLRSSFTLSSSIDRPMIRFVEKSVLRGFCSHCWYAAKPTQRLSSSSGVLSSLYDTNEGMMAVPNSKLLSTSASPLWKAAMTEFVVPRSIPMATSDIVFWLLLCEI